jgi:hypothetical protein
VENGWQIGILLSACQETMGDGLMAEKTAFHHTPPILELFYEDHEWVCVHVPFPTVVAI